MNGRHTGFRLFPLPWYSGGGLGWGRSLFAGLNAPTPALPRSTRGGGIWPLLLALYVLFWLGLLYDAPLATAVRRCGLEEAMRGSWLAELLKVPGTFACTIAVAALLLLWRRIGWREAMFILLAGALSGLNSIVKWIVGRPRPFHAGAGSRPMPFAREPFWHGWYGLFHQRDLAFPSGHASTSFALAAALWIVWPKWGRWTLLLAAFTACERISENAHYFSDVTAAALMSVVLVFAARDLIERRKDHLPQMNADARR